MMRFLLPLLLLVLTACSGHKVAPLNESAMGGDSLWRMRVIDAGETRFLGLLALNRSRESIAFTVLDPTGLRVAAGRIGPHGEVDKGVVLPPARELADYLGRVLPELFGASDGGRGKKRIDHSPAWVGPDLTLERMP